MKKLRLMRPNFAARQSIESHLKEKQYDENMVPEWIDAICSDCMKGLSDLNKPYKYVGEWTAMSSICYG